jgi:hypothetical protein
MFEQDLVGLRDSRSRGEEYRIVRKLSSSIETKDVQPFPVHLYELPANAVRRVIFGARVPHDQRTALVAETRADPAFGHVKFAEAVLDPGQFKVANLQPGDLEHKVFVEFAQQALPAIQLPPN